MRYGIITTFFLVAFSANAGFFDAAKSMGSSAVKAVGEAISGNNAKDGSLLSAAQEAMTQQMAKEGGVTGVIKSIGQAGLDAYTGATRGSWGLGGCCSCTG